MYRSKLMITREFLAHAMGLPESIEVSTIDYNVDRGIINVHLISGELIEGVTFEVAEGAETMTIAAGAWAQNKEQEENN